jgi:hypothetical protein
MNRSVLNKIISITGIIMFCSGLNSVSNPYGHLLGNDESCALWWAEGAYKIMRTDPVPSGKIHAVKLTAAANEYESFQLVLFPSIAINNFKIVVGDLRNESGGSISASQITVRKVEYVQVIQPTDDYGKPGWYPDPLPLLEQPIDLSAGINSPFFITIHVPASVRPGIYTGSLQLAGNEWNKILPLSVEVWHFSLPDQPSVRSSFGIGTDQIRQYHNLDTEKELQEVTDKYYAMMHKYKIAPTDPFSLYPMKVTVEGLNWEGGIFSDESMVTGNKSLKTIDDDFEANIEASTRALIKVDPMRPHTLSWYVKTLQADQKYCVLLKCYDAGKQNLIFENRMNVFTGQQFWGNDSLIVRPFREEIRFVSIHLFPVFRDNSGRHTGTAWFDNVRLITTDGGNNLVFEDNFMVDPETLDLNVDFEAFDKAGKKYLDELGFNAYNLALQGLPSGTFFEQRPGEFNGFGQGTAEYDYLMKEYLTIVEAHLEEMGWLGREYVYWFDEPNTENYPFVREGMEIIHRSAPKITRFITEHQPGPDIMDVTEISCTVIGQLDPDIITDLVDQGREFWSYVCCCPKAPYLSLFIDHDAINMRMWLWLSYKFKMKGILIWSANYWNSTTASPENFLQNPWEDAMSFMTGYGQPFGKQTVWGNGDGRFFYPPNRNPNDRSTKYLEGPVPCLRLENIRDGIEDYEYLVLLEDYVRSQDRPQKKKVREALKLLDIPGSLVAGPVNYDKDPQTLIRYRNLIGQLLNAVYEKP